MTEYHVNVNDKKSFRITLDAGNGMSGQSDGKNFSLDAIREKDGAWHVIRNHRSFRIDEVEVQRKEKKLVLRVNGRLYRLKLEDRFDRLLHDMGLDSLYEKKVNEIKAPMPGKVLKIEVREGETVQEGDALLVLEAMKMENVIKAPVTAVVKKVHVEAGGTVEKNQLLVGF